MNESQTRHDKIDPKLSAAGWGIVPGSKILVEQSAYIAPGRITTTCQVLALFGKGEHKYPPLKEEYRDRLITIDSVEFKELKLPFSVIETPGHTADHIAMMMDGILFCGDAAMNDFPSIKRTIIWIENLEEYKESWKKMIALNTRMVYPAHGKPFAAEDLKRFESHLEKIRLYPL